MHSATLHESFNICKINLDLLLKSEKPSAGSREFYIPKRRISKWNFNSLVMSIPKVLLGTERPI